MNGAVALAAILQIAFPKQLDKLLEMPLVKTLLLSLNRLSALQRYEAILKSYG